MISLFSKPVPTKVAVLVYNFCLYDSRVIKTAESMAQRGYDVTIFARNNGNLPEYKFENGVAYVRPLKGKATNNTAHRKTIFDESSGKLQLLNSIDLLVGYILFPIISIIFIAYMISGRKGYKKLTDFIRFYKYIYRSAKNFKLLRQDKSYKYWLISNYLLNRTVIFLQKNTPPMVRKYFMEDVYTKDVMVAQADAVVRAQFFEYVLAYRPDFIHVNDFVPLKVGVELSKALDVPVIYDVHEFESGRQDKSHGHRSNEAVLAAERELSNFISGSVTVSPWIADYYSDACRFKPDVILNTPRIMPSFARESELRELIGANKNDIVGVYCGILAKNRGIERVLAALSDCPSLLFVCIGPHSPVGVSYFNDIAKKHDVSDQFFILDAVNHDQLPHFMSGADFGIIPAVGITANQIGGLPNKLFEMIFAGLPILCADMEQRRKFVEAYGQGIFFPNDPNCDLVHPLRLMLSFCRQKRYRIKSKKLAVKAYHEIGWHRQMDRLETLYTGLLGK